MVWFLSEGTFFQITALLSGISKQKMLFALNPWIQLVVCRGSSNPLWPTYGRKFRFGTFNRGATRWSSSKILTWRVFRFGTLRQGWVKFIARIFTLFGHPTAKTSDSVLSTRVRPETMFCTFNCDATISLSWCFRPVVQQMGVNNSISAFTFHKESNFLLIL